MYKRIAYLLLFTLAGAFSNTSLRAQTTLPVFWDFTTFSPAPAGWTVSLGASGQYIYTGAGFFGAASPAARLDNTGEFISVWFAGKPGSVAYTIRNTGSTQPFQGTFDVQESADGNTWTNAKSYVNNLPGTMTRDSIALQAGSRYVRFYFTSKATGYNVALDDIRVTAAGPSALPELQTSFSGISLVNNGTIKPGNADTLKLSIRNRGTGQSLKISNYSFSGTNSADFGFISKPDSVDAGKTEQLIILFSKNGAAGTKRATLSFSTNDGQNPVFTQNIYGINGSTATEPQAPATGLYFPFIRTYRAIAAFAKTPSAEQYLVLRKKGAAVTEVPADGKSYEKGSYIGQARVVLISSDSNIRADFWEANTTYHFAVFPFNGYDSFVNYRTSDALTGSFSTGAPAIGTYYSSVDPNSNQFIQQLYARTRPHTQIFYSNYASYIIENFYARDTTGDKRVLNCTYSNYPYVYSPPFTFDVLSREHAYPSSWMPTTNSDSVNYSDLHLLFPVHQNEVNAVRSNFPLNTLKTVVSTFYDGKFGYDSFGNTAYEPRDEAKGQAARAMFYICACYNNAQRTFTIPSSLGFAPKQDQWILKKWNRMYPPTNRELARNDYVASVQNNRNPFIDNPDWACKIDFSNMSYISGGSSPCDKPAGGGSTSVQAARAHGGTELYPNPSGSSTNILLSTFPRENYTVRVFDYYWREVLSLPAQNSRNISISTSSLAPGNYLVMIQGETQDDFHNLIISR